MGLDIGQALREGASRTVKRNGLLLAGAFAVVAFLTTVLFQTLIVAALEATVSAFQGATPDELGLSQAEYDEAVTEFETTSDELSATSPLALGLPAGVAAAALLAVVLLSEAVSIVAVRLFASDEAESIPNEIVTENILLATLNGFIGAIVVWGLIFLGLLFLILPGIILAVLFYFLRQEIAINDKNFVQAMADSWRITKGNRLAVFLIGAVLVIISRLGEASSAAVSVLSTPGGAVVGAIVGGLLAAFGAAVATRAYVQIDEGEDETVEEDEPAEDPYDAALTADDLTR